MMGLELGLQVCFYTFPITKVNDDRYEKKKPAENRELRIKNREPSGLSDLICESVGIVFMCVCLLELVCAQACVCVCVCLTGFIKTARGATIRSVLLRTSESLSRVFSYIKDQL